jgi:hypothetical protein
MKTTIHPHFQILITLLTPLILLLVPYSVYSQGNLLIMPGRVVFEGNKKTININLANTGIDTAQYNISVVQFRMRDNGSFEEITKPDPGQFFADPFIRYFPRTVTLVPKGGQTVKIQLVNQADLKPGEYRSHLYFRAVPSDKPLGESDPAKDSSALAVKLIPIFGITIPVIIRVGENQTEVRLSAVEFFKESDTIPKLKMTFNRTGNMSVYGDLIVNHISPEGKVTMVGSAKGIAVYTPNLKRNFQFGLKPTKDIDYTKGRLHLSYSAQSDVQPSLLAEYDYPLQ